MVDRWERSIKIKEQLLMGQNCWFVSTGNSLRPVMHSGDAIALEPIIKGQTVELGDIVFAEVQYGPRFYVHMVHALQKDVYGDKVKYYWIGNIRGRFNGWSYREHIHGRVVKVEMPVGEDEFLERIGWDVGLRRYARQAQDEEWHGKSDWVYVD